MISAVIFNHSLVSLASEGSEISPEWSTLLLRCYRVKGQHGRESQENLATKENLLQSLKQQHSGSDFQSKFGLFGVKGLQQMYIHNNINIKKMCH